MQILPVTQRDLADIHALESSATAFPWPISQFASSVASNDCRMMKVDDNLVGFAIFSLAADELTLLNIAVAPNFQGNGYARAMLLDAFESFKRKNARLCFLEVRVSNHNAIALYQSLGFNEVGERRNYYPAVNGREDALVMCLELQLDEEIS